MPVFECSEKRNRSALSSLFEIRINVRRRKKTLKMIIILIFFFTGFYFLNIFMNFLGFLGLSVRYMATIYKGIPILLVVFTIPNSLCFFFFLCVQ